MKKLSISLLLLFVLSMAGSYAQYGRAHYRRWTVRLESTQTGRRRNFNINASSSDRAVARARRIARERWHGHNRRGFRVVFVRRYAGAYHGGYRRAPYPRHRY